MFELLRALGLNPLEWSQLVSNTGQGSPYIGEILDAGFDQAAAVVAMLTPDDLASLHPSLLDQNDPDFEQRPTGQARPNVLFETGMAFGRNPERTIIVQIGNLRPFSDVTGRHVVRFDDSATARNELRNRLKAADCAVTESGSDWLSAGNFTTNVESHPSSGPAEFVRNDAEDQMQSLRELIQQMRTSEMWLSQIFRRGPAAFDGIPAGVGLIDYPLALRLLHDKGAVEIFEERNLRYNAFGETFSKDYRFSVRP